MTELQSEHTHLTTLISTIMVIVFVCLIYTCCYKVSEKIDYAMPPAQHVEFDKLLVKHGLYKRFSVIEVKWDGSKWFLRKGELCRFQ